MKIDFGRSVEYHANYYDEDMNLLSFGKADFAPVSDHYIKKASRFR